MNGVDGNRRSRRAFWARFSCDRERYDRCLDAAASRLKSPFAFFLGAAVSGVLLAIAPRASASDVQLVGAAGLTGYASTWRGDFGGGGTLRAGVRFAHWIQPDVQVWESFATVNERLNTGLSLGVSALMQLGAVRPYLRLYAIHQHEEGLVSVEYAPAGFLFGIGAGIRHRAGGGLELGFELPMVESRSGRTTGALFAEVNSSYFPDDTLGPSAYVGLDAGIALDYLLR